MLLFYTKGDVWTWNTPTQPYTDDYLKRFKWEGSQGKYRKTLLKTYSKSTLQRLADADRLLEPSKPGGNYSYKQYLHESSGVRQHDDVWTDINMINPVANERLGYPTQKPEALLERVVSASSDEGHVVLDPFCGCGTTVAVAQRLRRAWVGIDVTFLAVDLIDKRLVDSYGEAVRDTYEVRGIPRDVGAARALFDRSPFEFERWAVSLVEGQPNEKQVGDRGVDGVVRFTLDESDAVGRALVSVKGGGRLNPAMVRDLVGTVESQGDQMGVLVTMEPPTKGMVEAAGRSGTFVWEVTGRRFPRVQVVTVPDLLSGVRPNLPPTYLPYVKARRQQLGQQGRLSL